jgi:hypothetical protein
VLKKKDIEKEVSYASVQSGCLTRKLDGSAVSHGEIA